MTCLPTAVSCPVSDWTMPILIVSRARASPDANDAAASTAAAVTECLRNMDFLPENWWFVIGLADYLRGPARQLGTPRVVTVHNAACAGPAIKRAEWESSAVRRAPCR